MNATKVQLVNQWVLLVTYRNMGVTDRHRRPNMGESSQKLGNTAHPEGAWQVGDCPFQVPQEVGLNLFQGAQAGLCFFPHSWFGLRVDFLLRLLCSLASVCLRWSLSLSLMPPPPGVCNLPGSCLVNLNSFRDFLKLSWIAYLPV